MKRFLKLLGVFLGVAIVVLGIVIGLSWEAVKTTFKNQEGLAEGSEWVEKTYSLKGLSEFIGSHPGNVSIVSYTLNKPDSGIYYQADRRRTMGGLVNLLYIIEYVHQVESGILNPESSIAFSELDKYDLPDVKEGVHEDVREFWQAQGWIDEGSIKLKYLAHTLAEFNDPILSDYFYYKLGRSQLRQLYETLDLTATNRPLPYIGYYITINPSITNKSPKEHLDSLQKLPRKDFERIVRINAKKYINNSSSRSRIRKQFRRNGLPLSFIQQREFNRLLPTTTARQLAHVMEALAKGNLFTYLDLEQKIRGILDWPMQNSQMKQDFVTYGAIYDSRIGILNGVDFGVSEYTNRTYLQCVMFDDLPVGFWFHASSNYMNQDFQQRLIWDPALQETVREEISNNNKTSVSTSTYSTFNFKITGE